MLVAEPIAAALVVIAVVAGLRARRAGVRRPDVGPSLRTTAGRLYSRRTLLRWGVATAGAALLVYGGADEAVDAWQRERNERRPDDDLERGVARQAKRFGEPYWVGVWSLLALVDRFVGPSAVSRFGRRCAEATLLGLPILWSTQRLLGGSRPTDEIHGSRFVPFADENAASGHTFIAAVPWLVLVRELRPRWARPIATALSTVTGWSRVHDRRHYVSQVALGWFIAWEATGAGASATEDGAAAQGSAADSAAPSTRAQAPG